MPLVASTALQRVTKRSAAPDGSPLPLNNQSNANATSRTLESTGTSPVFSYESLRARALWNTCERPLIKHPAVPAA